MCTGSKFFNTGESGMVMVVVFMTNDEARHMDGRQAAKHIPSRYSRRDYQASGLLSFVSFFFRGGTYN